MRLHATAIIFCAITSVWGCAKHATTTGEGVPLTVRVVDAEGQPIATAVVRHPEEAERHRVNAVTGEWTDSVLYLPDGGELVFNPGMTLRLEVSAPQFLTKVVQYDVRKRNNRINVTLQPLVLEEDEFETPIIPFIRDQDRDPSGGGPSN